MKIIQKPIAHFPISDIINMRIKRIEIKDIKKAQD